MTNTPEVSHILRILVFSHIPLLRIPTPDKVSPRTCWSQHPNGQMYVNSEGENI
jgi:hypothetical protein